MDMAYRHRKTIGAVPTDSQAFFYVHPRFRGKFPLAVAGEQKGMATCRRCEGQSLEETANQAFSWTIHKRSGSVSLGKRKQFLDSCLVRGLNFLLAVS